MIELLIEVKKIVPEYVRIQRLGRDIPANSIVAGCKTSNIREVVSKKVRCKCIRCREIRDNPSSQGLTLKTIIYRASGGTEYFLQYIDQNNRLYAMLRLRIPSYPFIAALKKAAIVRELHTYGAVTNFSKKGSVQHRGLGGCLLDEAELLTKNLGIDKVAVISGIGVRDYYRKKGYRLKNTYMIKKLK